MMHTIRLFLLIMLSTAQLASAEVSAELAISPEYPAPFQQIKVTLSSYSFDVNTALITWKSGTRTLSSGVGQKSIGVQLGDAGTNVPISYTATTAQGDSVSGSITITPQSVDILYETKESYVPPFYEGKALPGEGAVLRVTAFPTVYEGGSRIPPGSLAYSWYINGNYSPNISGAGKQSVSVTMDYLTTTTDIRVMVRSPRGNVAEKTITVYPVTPLPSLYMYDMALGADFSKSLPRRVELSKEVTLSLEPYYFSTNALLEQSALYGWYLDGLPLSPQDKTLVTLRPAPNSSGARTLSVILENSKRLLQKAQADFEIVFDTRN